jgi:hypothetical protein
LQTPQQELGADRAIARHRDVQNHRPVNLAREAQDASVR